ncbi:MAG: NADH-quinone oxidoreductase subunit NuoG [Candidatus Zixiibacteriota bacterium]
MADVVKTTEQVAVVKTVTFTIDGRTTTVPKGTTVLQAALDMGIAIPTFCWHPKLKPVGACRMCYVEIERMPKLQVSCATEATEGMVVHTDSDQVKRGRKAVIEFLLTNHPLDCPTCDKGGECDLQNLTFAHGFDDSRFEFYKRRHIPEGVKSTFDDLRIGPEIILNRNRCILCYKCVRSNKEAFGEYDLGAYERGNITEINAAPGELVDNPFSGNLVEICPVGALTNTDWRYKIRVWLTQQAQSICNFTSSGTNITFYKEDHQKKIFRTTSRRNDAIDDGWLADVTRYGYQIVHSPDRLQTPLIKKNGKQAPASWDEALALVARKLRDIRDARGAACVGGLIGPNQDNATLYSFNKYLRTVIGTNAVDFRSEYRSLPTDPQSPYAVLAMQPFTIADIDLSDLIVVFGSDLVNEHPNEYLRIRKARNFSNPKIYSVNAFAVKSADVADLELTYAVGTDEAFVNGLCLAAIEQNLADSQLCAQLKKSIAPLTLAEAAALCGVASTDLKHLAKALSESRKLTFVIGEQVTRSKQRDVIAASLCNLVRLLGLNQRGQVAVLAQHANSVGAEMLGALPSPATAVRTELSSIWRSYPESPTLSTDHMLEQMLRNELDAFLVVAANPIMMYPDRTFVTEAIEKLDFLVVCDLFETETSALADVVLPLAAWAEYGGAYVNFEWRVQTVGQGIKPRFDVRPGYVIIEALADLADRRLFASDADRQKEIDSLLALQRRLEWPDQFLEVKPSPEKTDKQYPYALIVGDDPHHRGYVTEKAASLVNFCGEAYIELSRELAEKLDIEVGTPVRVESATGKVVVTAKISDHLDNDVVFMPRNFSAAKVNALQSRSKRVDRIRISKAVD